MCPPVITIPASLLFRLETDTDVLFVLSRCARGLLLRVQRTNRAEIPSANFIIAASLYSEYH